MKKIIFSTLCISALITACSSEEYIAEDGNAHKLMLATTIDAPLTRAGTNVQSTQFANGQKLGIWTFTGTGSSAVYQNKNIPMTADGSGHLTTDGDGIFYDPATSVNVWAMHPYLGYLTDAWQETTNYSGFQFQIQGSQNSEDAYKATDLCSGCLYGIKADNNKHVIPMKHLMSKITVHLVDGDANDQHTLSAGNIANIGILTQDYATVTLNKLQATSGQGPIVSVTAKAGDSKKSCQMAMNTLDCSMIVPPGQKYAVGDKMFWVNFNNREGFTYQLQNALTLEAGKEYIFTFYVKLKKIDVNVEIKNWDTVDKTGVIQY